jgi:predicted phage baseplate assembly protein
MPLPKLNLDDKTFNELYEESRALIPRYARDWTDHNPSDPGITLIDLFSWLAEMQIYYLDRVTDKNYLKFLKLLGERPAPPSSATAHVTFTLSDPKAPPVIVPKKTQVAATDPLTAERIVFETDEKVLVHSCTLQRVLTQVNGQWVDNSTSNGLIGVSYFAFGEDPARGDTLYLGFGATSAFPKAKIRLIVAVYDRDLRAGVVQAGADVVPSAELEWQYWSGAEGWKRLKVKDGTAALTMNGRLSFIGPGDIKRASLRDIKKNVRVLLPEELYWLRASVKAPGYEIPPRLDTVMVNTVSATHGTTIKDEHSSATGLPFQKVKLRNRPVLHRTVELKIKEDNQRRREGEEQKWHEWTEVDDFDASGPEDRHFTVNLKDGLLKFGDGVHGRIPPAVEDKHGNIKVVKYRVGGGEKGNVKASTIVEILAPELPELKNNLKVTNARPSAGGREAEPLDEAKSRARRSLKEVTRGVTTTDFETLTTQTPGIRVARVKVLTQYHPNFPAIQMPGAVTIVVVPETLPPMTDRLPVPSSGFLKSIYRHLKSKSIITTNLSVIGPEFIEVKVVAAIRVDPWMSAENVRVQVVDKLRAFLNPLTGSHDGKGWPFGRPVYKSEIYELIETVPGVVCVERIALFGKSCDSAQTDRITLRKIGLVYSGEQEITVC